MVGLLAAVAMLLATAAVPRAAIASLPATADGWVLADLPQPGGEPVHEGTEAHSLDDPGDPHPNRARRSGHRW